MELASMLGGERFTDRPASVCPIVAAVVRAYNDAVDQRRRQDLYRFAADAVGTRGDFALQRRRAELALELARRDRMPKREPDSDAGPDEIAEHVVRSMARRANSRSAKRRFDDASHAEMLVLLERLIATGRVDSDLLLGEFVEHCPESVEHGGGEHELLIAELGHGGPEPRLELSSPGFDECVSTVGQVCEHDATVALRARTFDEPRLTEAFEHLGDTRRAQGGGLGELAGGQPLVALPQAEEQAVLGVAEHPASVSLPTPHPPKGGHRAFERSAELLGGIAVLALACHAGRRFAERVA
jgi:hypothetical protein